MNDGKLKIFISSTVYGYGSDIILDQVKGCLEGFGYEVIMSKEGTVYVPIGMTNEQACLEAIKNCDLFFGIIFARYGSGITHKEFLKAVKLDKPRWFSAHFYIEYTRKLMQQFMFDKHKSRNTFDIKPTCVLDSLKVVDMFNDVKERWVHSYFKPNELLNFLDYQFKDIDLRRKELESYKND
ncbi:MAG: DUF4062 domain-containing protein [Candidatus Marinimicrobia bacterium]|nr:DUF4062 domain-containing protein [Candidatus Neomarinimicrobiota bacterium]